MQVRVKMEKENQVTVIPTNPAKTYKQKRYYCKNEPRGCKASRCRRPLIQKHEQKCRYGPKTDIEDQLTDMMEDAMDVNGRITSMMEHVNQLSENRNSFCSRIFL